MTRLKKTPLRRLLIVARRWPEDVRTKVRRRHFAAGCSRNGNCKRCARSLMPRGNHVKGGWAAPSSASNHREPLTPQLGGAPFGECVVGELHSAEHYRFGYPNATPFRSFPETVTLGTMPPMDASTARTTNMRRLVAEAGGPAEWARAFGGSRWTQPQVSQWISEASPKGIGNKLARDLESAMALTHGTLDRTDVTASNHSSHPAGLDFEKIANAVKVLSHYLELVGDPPEWVHDALLLETAYAVVVEFERPSTPDNVLDLTKLLAKRIRGSTTDEQQVRRTGAAAGR